MAYNAAIKRKKLLIYATKWLDLRNIMPVDTKWYMFIYINFPENAKP